MTPEEFMRMQRVHDVKEAARRAQIEHDERLIAESGAGDTVGSAADGKWASAPVDTSAQRTVPQDPVPQGLSHQITQAALNWRPPHDPRDRVARLLAQMNGTRMPTPADMILSSHEAVYRGAMPASAMDRVVARARQL